MSGKTVIRGDRKTPILLFAGERTYNILDAVYTDNLWRGTSYGNDVYLTFPNEDGSFYPDREQSNAHPSGADRTPHPNDGTWWPITGVASKNESTLFRQTTNPLPYRFGETPVWDDERGLSYGGTAGRILSTDRLRYMTTDSKFMNELIQDFTITGDTSIVSTTQPNYLLARYYDIHNRFKVRGYIDAHTDESPLPIHPDTDKGIVEIFASFPIPNFDHQDVHSGFWTEFTTTAWTPWGVKYESPSIAAVGIDGLRIPNLIWHHAMPTISGKGFKELGDRDTNENFVLEQKLKDNVDPDDYIYD
jgi:hypothetical protein